MPTNLSWISEKARKKPDLVFTSLYHHITDVDNLRVSYNILPGGKAVGLDGVSKKDYGKKLEENLADLSARLKRMGYRPQAKRRSYIPKAGSEKGRPLGISCFEDKIVELSVKRVLEPIYETMFEETSYGYRPNLNAHDCLDALGKTIQQKRVNYVVEADIRGFFDHMKHQWLIKFLEHRIGDKRVIRLIHRMLKAGVMEDGLVKASESGSPQGSILSPLLSNIYLHYVLDLWYSKRIKGQCRSESYYFRFADDYLACFQYGSDAEGFLQALKLRLEEFGLEIAEEKTQCIPFGRFAREEAYKRGRKPKDFTFFGFTHYCGKTRNGYFKVKRKTSRKKQNRSLREFTEWAKVSRHVLKKGEMLKRARSKVIGHLNYYAITDNSAQCKTFVYHATHILFKWINRKSQKRAYNWDRFNQALAWVNWPTTFVLKDLNPCYRTEVR